MLVAVGVLIDELEIDPPDKCSACVAFPEDARLILRQRKWTTVR